MPENTNENSSNGNNTGSSWGKYQALVPSELLRLDKNINTIFEKINTLDSKVHDEMSKKVEEIKESISTIKTSLAVLQTKAAMYGAVGGALLAGGIELIVYLVSGHK